MSTSNGRSTKGQRPRGRAMQPRTLGQRMANTIQRSLYTLWRAVTTVWWALGRLCVQLGGTFIAMIQAFQRVCGWITRHFVWPAVLFTNICVGVVLSALLPASLWTNVAVPQVAQWTGIPLHAFPLAQVPTREGWLLIVVASLGIAAVVFHEGGFDQLQQRQRPLLTTVIAAVALGVRWPRVWFRRPPDQNAPPPAASISGQAGS